MPKGIAIQIECLDIQPIVYRFENLSRKLLDFQPVFREILSNFCEELKTQFTMEGGYLSRKWAALSKPYKEWKDIYYPGTTILVASGRMRNLATDPTKNVHLTKNELVKYVPTYYTKYHQTGTSKMPARPLVERIPENIQKNWRNVINRWLRELWLG